MPLYMGKCMGNMCKDIGPHVRTFANIVLLAPWPTRKLRTLWSLRRIYETCRSSGNQRLSPPTIAQIARI